MKRFAILVLSAFLFTHCQKAAEEKMHLSSANELHGLASPIQLQFEPKTVFLEDYFMHPSAIDSIRIPEGLSMIWQKDSNTLQLDGNISTGLSNIRFYIKNDVFDIPVKRSSQEKYTLSIPKTALQANTIQIKGSFNNWDKTANVFTETENAFVTDFFLFPGQYEYVLVADGKEILDPTNPDSVSNGFGGFNSLIRIGNSHQNDLFITPDTIELNSILVKCDPEKGPIKVFWQNNVLDEIHIVKAAKGYWINIPKAEAPGRTFLRIWQTSAEDISNDLLIPMQDGKVVKSTNQLTRQDWEKSIFYFLMIDRFWNGNSKNDHPVNDPEIDSMANYFGGDIAGVTQKLKDGYFDSLGINTIWLSPITKNPADAWGLWDEGVRSKFSGYHGYWPISNVLPDPRFATETELKTLLDEAHKKNINVILDYVANHVHQSHSIYQNNKDWATPLYLPDGTMNTEKWDEHRLTTWFDSFLPTLDLRKKEIVEPMTDSALVWVTKYDFDGFRHDATKHIDELYWRVLMRKLKERVMIPQQKRIYQIGETYGSAKLINSYIGSGMLDAQFNFNLYDKAVETFALEKPMEPLAAELKEALKTYGSHNLMGNISGNQDRSRFITLADGDLQFDEDQKLAGWTREFGKPTHKSSYKKLALMHAFNFAIPGIPVIYYGDEYGLPGANDPDNRRQMQFDNLDQDEAQLRKTVAKLTQLREENLALIYGTTTLAEDKNGLLIITRKYFDNEVIIVINNSAKSQKTKHIPAHAVAQFSEAKNRTISPFGFEYFIHTK